MDLQAIELSELSPAQLDGFLAFGWFRIQQTIFTTDALQFYGETYQPVWLRIKLDELHTDKQYRLLMKKNARFRKEIVSACITPEHEELFEKYRTCVPFEAAPNLQWLLNGESSSNIYNTQVINLYDGDTLIAAGFFDLGKNSAAGIVSYFHPDYKKFSLGRYMIFEKNFYCKRKGFQYFYPGYFVPGYPAFDYKLDIGKGALEYFNVYTKTWLKLPELLV